MDDNGGPIRKEDKKRVTVRPHWFMGYIVLFGGAFVLALTVGVLARICYETFLWGWQLLGWA